MSLLAGQIPGTVPFPDVHHGKKILPLQVDETGNGAYRAAERGSACRSAGGDIRQQNFQCPPNRVQVRLLEFDAHFRAEFLQVEPGALEVPRDIYRPEPEVVAPGLRAVRTAGHAFECVDEVDEHAPVSAPKSLADLGRNAGSRGVRRRCVPGRMRQYPTVVVMGIPEATLGVGQAGVPEKFLAPGGLGRICKKSVEVRTQWRGNQGGLPCHYAWDTSFHPVVEGTPEFVVFALSKKLLPYGPTKAPSSLMR